MKKEETIEDIEQSISNETLLFKELFEASIKDIAILDCKSRFLYVNESYLVRTGYTKEELLGKKANILKSGFHNDAFYDNLWSTLNSNKNFNAIFTNKNKSGGLYHEEQTIIPIGESGETQNFLVVGVDSCDTISEELNSLCMQDI